MPGNEVGDRVHNFFAEDNLPQGQHHSQVADGSWPSLNNNFWGGSQKQVGVLTSSPRNYNSLQSDFGRADNGRPLHVNHGPAFTQTNLRSDFANSKPQSEQMDFNGYMYGRQNFPGRQDEANFSGVDTESDRHNMNPRGSFVFELQKGGVSENIRNNSVRSNTSDTPVTFDLFGGQQHINKQSNLMHALPQQQSGFAHMQQLQQQSGFAPMQQLQQQQQQLMFRKMQELQRQKELQQLDARKQNTSNQVPSFARQVPHSLIDGNQIADASTYPWGELSTGNPNWLQRASPAMQGTSSGFAFSPEQGRSMGFAHQRVDHQSLYGVPVSDSRGNTNQYPRMATEKTTSVQHMPVYSNSFPNQYPVFSDQVNTQHGTFPSRQGPQGKSSHHNSPGQSSNSAMNSDHFHLLNPLQQDAPLQEFQSTHELIGPTEILQDKKPIDDTVSLDPSEEKILFGSDDNIWDAFGTDTITGEGASNILDGNDFLNGFPSMQSGSWSALMQSAVAETSSSDVHEKVVGLSCHNTELPTGAHQPSRYDGGEKRQITFAENSHTGSSVSLGSVPNSDGGNATENFRNSLGFLHGERLQSNSPKRLNSHWTSQQSGSSQLVSKVNNLNGTESAALSVDRGRNLSTSEHSLQHPQSNNWKKGQHEDICHNDSIWKVDFVPKSLGSPQMIREDFAVNAAVSNLSTGAPVGEDNGQFLLNNHRSNYWKHVHSSTKSKGNEGLGKLQHHLNKGPQVSESSLNSSEKEELKMHEVQSRGAKENSSSGHNFNTSQHVNLSTDGRQKSSNQVVQRTSAPRKFQYHPMGDLDEDVELSYKTRQGNHLEAMSQQHSLGLKGQDKEFFGQSKLCGQVPKVFADTVKGHALDQQGEAKGYEEGRSSGTFPGYMPNMFGSVERSSGLSVPNNSQPSQNMLELLHKVDQSREHSTTKHLNPSEQNQSSEIPDAENSDGSIGHLQRSQSSSSQGFGLQLAPPQQRFSARNHASSITLQAVPCNSNSLTQTETTDKGSGVPPYSRSQGQSQSMIAANVLVGQPAEGFLVNAGGFCQYNNASLFDINRTTSVSTPLERAQPTKPSMGEKFPGHTSIISQHGSSSSAMPNLWTNGPPQHPSLGTQTHKFHANRPHPHPRQSIIVESTSLDKQIENNDAEKKGSFSSELSTNSDVSLLNPASTQNDLEAFGRSLKPNSFHQSCSLLNQVQAMKDSDSDPSHRRSKRVKGPDSFLGGQQVVSRTGQPNESNNMLADVVTAQDTTVSSANSNMLSFSGRVDNVEKSMPPQLGSVSSSYAHGNNISSIKAEHTQISPQMAPSWFNQYGAFKNGQILPVPEMRKGATVKIVEQAINVGNSSGGLVIDKSKELASPVAGSRQMEVIMQNLTPPSVTIERFSSPLPANVSDKNSLALRQGKRKSFHPWHREVSQSSPNPLTPSMAEVEWAIAANRCSEKVKDDGQVIEDIAPVIRSRKRLVLTTQLMQLLLRPPPATILSGDASSNYDIVSYFVTRLALGDACGLASSAKSSSDVHPGESHLSKPSERVDVQHLSEAVETFMGWARKLENDLLSMERASVSDLRVECQDLEKFSVINRFAKFHGRGQSDGSSSDPAANAQKPVPQRYVTAVPLPKNLPDTVHCLSL